MPCNHRFQDQLLPVRERIDYLFIGTFNPAWDADNGNNAHYFYGRGTNLFWCIMPHAFQQPCLIGENVPAWKAFCHQFHIGITDLIISIPDAEYNNPLHRKALTVGFGDESIDERRNGQEVFQLTFITEDIKQLITQHQATLRGVFFTRTTSGRILRIWNQWTIVQNHCEQLGIPAIALPSPSPRRGSIRDKINTWREHIQPLL